MIPVIRNRTDRRPGGMLKFTTVDLDGRLIDIGIGEIKLGLAANEFEIADAVGVSKKFEHDLQWRLPRNIYSPDHRFARIGNQGKLFVTFDSPADIIYPRWEINRLGDPHIAAAVGAQQDTPGGGNGFFNGIKTNLCFIFSTRSCPTVITRSLTRQLNLSNHIMGFNMYCFLQ